jgi:hypothetical protein
MTQQRNRRVGGERAERQRDGPCSGDHQECQRHDQASTGARREDLAGSHTLDTGLRDQVGDTAPEADTARPAAIVRHER